MPIEQTHGLPLPLSGETRVYAIIGDPISQVGSPGLFNSAFRNRNSQAVLAPFHVAPDQLPDIVAAFRATRNFDGLVVTVPHKIAIADLVDELGPMARRIGAVNAIRKNADGQLLGENFDGLGFIRGLANRGHYLRGKKVLVIGAGGAGSAVCHAIVDEKPSSLRIFDTDTVRLHALVTSLNAVGEGVQVAAGIADADGYDCIVNCTSIGMRPTDPYPVRIERLTSSTLVVDIILKPPLTPLLMKASELGCTIHEGKHMLEGQVDAICDFFNIAAAVD